MNTLTLTAIRLRECRIAAKETLEDIARLAGVNRTTVLRWERGETSRIRRSTLEQLARHYDVSPLWLTGETDDRRSTERWFRENAIAREVTVTIPVLGAVRAGVGGVVFEEQIGTETVDADSIADGESYFYLRVTGDSMAPTICEGDYVLVRRQDSVDNGNFAIVIVDDEEALVKRVVYLEDGVELQSINPYYPPRRFTARDTARVRILGLVRESKRKFA